MNLQDYLDDRTIAIADFAKTTGLSRVTIYRIINGLPIQRHTAARIVKASENLVKFEDLGFLK